PRVCLVGGVPEFSVKGPIGGGGLVVPCPPPAIKSAALASTPIVVVPVVKRVAPRVVPVVVIDHGSFVPIASPMVPAPSVTPEPTDSVADSEREVRTAIPDSGI